MGPLPSVSVVVVARNCAHQILTCLEHLKCQNYPNDILEIIVVDGNSTDNTRDVALSFDAHVVKGGFPENAEARRYVGTIHAKNEIILFLDTDNLIKDKQWLRKMVRPFMNTPDLVGAFTKWYGYDSETSALDQYYALIGGNDPIAFYLGKNDRVPHQDCSLPWGGQLVTNQNDYQIVKFDAEKLPAIGCNGFLIRKNLINQLSFQDPNHYLHTDVNVDIIKKLGLNKFAIVKNSIIHATGDTLSRNITKRLKYMKIHHIGLSGVRRYKVFDPKSLSDQIKMVRSLVFILTLIEPVLRAIRGYLKTGNANWLFHPLVSVLITFAYFINIVHRIISR